MDFKNHKFNIIPVVGFSNSARISFRPDFLIFSVFAFDIARNFFVLPDAFLSKIFWLRKE